MVRWVKEDLLDSKDPIKVLVGAGGSGKTVICQQIYQSLIAEDIPVIGIKADQISAKSHIEFIQSLGLQDDLYKLLTSASLMKNRVVVIVDQIDALSLSLSADRSSITIMLNIIQQLLTVPHVRIIVSCREYDLHFDPMLQKYEDHNKVEVKELEREKVEYILSSLGIDTKQISDKLLKLLQHPHHLDVFSDIYSSDLELNSILTLQDMYKRLWERKVSVKGEEYRLIEILDFVSKKMSTDQRIVIGAELLLDRWPVGTRYLLSEGILIQAANNCQFFHQSFFDYTFARFFVNREESLAKYILSRHQGLFIRSQLKQVLAYLRNINEAGYADGINRLFDAKNTRLHLKLAIINQIGSEINPLDSEKEIIENFVLVNPILRRSFLDSIRSEAWFDWLMQKDLLISYLDSPDQDLAQGSGWMLITLVQYFPGKVLSYLNNLYISERNDKIISEVLFSLKDWKQAQALSLFERIALYLNKSEDFRISHIYINALNDQPEWVKDKLLEYILEKINSKATNEESTHLERDFISSEMGHVLDKLKKLHPDLYYDLAYNVVPLLTLKTKMQWRESPFYLDGAFYGYDDFGSLYEHWKLLDGVIEYFRNIALNDCQKYEGLSADLLSSNSITLLTIVIEGWNQYPQNYIEQILQLLRRNDLLKEHSHYTKSFGIGVRKLISNVYTYLDESQKTRLDLQILEAEPDNEKSKENYSYHLRGLNQYRLLWAIPENERKGRYEVNRKFLELKRKFGKYKEDSLKRHEHQMSGVGPPLPDSAYKYMTFTQWLETFKEYDDSTGWEANYHNPKDFHKGGLVEHYRAFGGCIKAEPDKYYPFVLTLINEAISESYLSEALRAFTEINVQFDKAKRINSINWNQVQKSRLANKYGIGD